MARHYRYDIQFLMKVARPYRYDAVTYEDGKALPIGCSSHESYIKLSNNIPGTWYTAAAVVKTSVLGTPGNECTSQQQWSCWDIDVHKRYRVYARRENNTSGTAVGIAVGIAVDTAVGIDSSGSQKAVKLDPRGQTIYQVLYRYC